VRQMLFGQRYFESQGWGRCEVAWLPDTFGLTGSLPQLIRSAGMKYFFTQKLSWNNINTFPHSTFNWVGIDGSQVLCHMTPVDTYTAQATVGDVNKGLTNHKNLESSAQSLLVFGNGDGGGGPLAKMLENLRRIRATTNNHRELPRVSMGRSVDEFYEELLKKSDAGKKLPNWHGELYLEFHRGTYTSHGSIKKGNRHSEILLRDVELVCTLASLFVSNQAAANVDAESTVTKKGYVYPKKKIDECWEKVLLNQFHDVLPGSAIGIVYEDAEKLYAEVKKDGTQLLNEALDILFPESIPLHQSPTNNPQTLIALNTTPLPRRSILPVPLSTAYASHNESTIKPFVAQVSAEEGLAYVVMECGEGERVMRGVQAGDRCVEGFGPAFALTNGSDHFVLKNGMVQLTLSKGRITSLVDTRIGRELIEPGQTGGLVIFDDKPVYWPAWDVEVYHLETAKQLAFEEVSVVAQGPLRASVKAKLKYGKSTITVTISLDAVTATTHKNSRPLFVFDADIDWRQRNEFLKFELPLTIRSPNATYETQFGWVQRPTHKNTTWDQAKFEVCGHKYADLSEFGYGVALLSESKYGFSCLGSVLRMSLLRAAEAPDAEQDQGQHTFSWAVMPHLGSFLESDVPQAAYLFNSPLHVRSVASTGVSNAFSPPLRVVGGSNVFLETIKRGEDDDFSSSSQSTETAEAKPTSIVLRLYEAFGGHGRVGVSLSPALNVVQAFETNILEDHEKELGLLSAREAGFGKDNEAEGANAMVIPLSFRGFEVKTIKLILGKADAKLLTTTGQDPAGKRESWVTVDETVL
jgi:alpha-mannosidase